MINLSEISYGWGVGVIIGLLLIWLAIWLVRRRKKHDHDWRVAGVMTIKRYPRLVLYCRDCAKAVHLPIYTRKKLMRMEGR